MFLNLAGLPAKIAQLMAEVKTRSDVPVSTRASSAEVAKAAVCTEARLSVLDHLGSNIDVSAGVLYKTVALTGTGEFVRPDDMIGDMLYLSGCGAGGNAVTAAKGQKAAAVGGESCMNVPYLMDKPAIHYSCPEGGGASVVFGRGVLRGGYIGTGVTPSPNLTTLYLAESVLLANFLHVGPLEFDLGIPGTLSFGAPKLLPGIIVGGAGLVAPAYRDVTSEYVGAFGGKRGQVVGGSSVFGAGATSTEAPGPGGGAISEDGTPGTGGKAILVVHYQCRQ